MQRSAPRLTRKHMAGIVQLCEEARTIQRIKSALVKGWTVARDAGCVCGGGAAVSSAREELSGARLKWKGVSVCENPNTHAHTHIYHVEAHLNRFSPFKKKKKNCKQMMCTCAMCLGSDYNWRRKNITFSSNVLYTILSVSIGGSKQRVVPWVMQTLTDTEWDPYITLIGRDVWPCVDINCQRFCTLC